MNIKIESGVKDYYYNLLSGEPPAEDLLNTPLENTAPNAGNQWALNKFKEYVNKGRSPFSLNKDNHFTRNGDPGNLQVLKNFKKSFEQSFKGTCVYIDEKYIEGEFIPIVTKVTYNGGER